MEPQWPLFLKVNPRKQGLFQSKTRVIKGFPGRDWISHCKDIIRIPTAKPINIMSLECHDSFCCCCSMSQPCLIKINFRKGFLKRITGNASQAVGMIPQYSPAKTGRKKAEKMPRKWRICEFSLRIIGFFGPFFFNDPLFHPRGHFHTPNGGRGLGRNIQVKDFTNKFT